MNTTTEITEPMDANPEAWRQALTFRMDPFRKAKWTEALRGGEFKQGDSYLHRQIGGSDCYCCLGVFAFLFYEELDLEWHVSCFGAFSYGDSDTILTPELADLVGSDTGHIPVLDRANAMLTLTTLNDSGMPFSQIADVIDYFF